MAQVIHCVGHLVHADERQSHVDSGIDDDVTSGASGSEDSNSGASGSGSGVADKTPKKPSFCLLAIGQPIPHPSNIEAALPRQTFLAKHGLDMRFTYADEK